MVGSRPGPVGSLHLQLGDVWRGLVSGCQQQRIAGRTVLRSQWRGCPYMSVNFIVEEARAALKLAMSLGTKFLLLGMTKSSSFLPVMRDEGALTQDWQLLGSESTRVTGAPAGFTMDDIPIAFMQFFPVSKGPKFPEFEKEVVVEAQG
ncbi:unnamed protein product [Polarella glacialis]|uniref:Uncharacterized protein n=1 Tax=Polarella glacialis TaxID=89957 RepID=A0A813KV14_POLGL|nr:unnamed protein product [Polarella glacialis]